MNGDIHQVFTIRAVDPDEDPYKGKITVRNASTGNVVSTFSTALALSGRSSSGFRTVPLLAGSYTWSASATDIHDNQSPESVSRPFTVEGRSEVGGGSVSGSMSFAQPIPRAADAGSPLTFQPCAPTSFTLNGFSAAGVASPTPFFGPFTFSGSGGSPCETAALGSGTLQLSAQGTGFLGSTFACPVLSGGYTRAGTNVDAVLGGWCSVNGGAGSMTLDLRLVLAPTSGGGTQPMTAAHFEGAFIVAPSS